MRLTHKTALQLLPPGDVVYTLTAAGGVAEVRVLEVCDGWLETDHGMLDFDDHTRLWWLTGHEASRATGVPVGSEKWTFLRRC